VVVGSGSSTSRSGGSSSVAPAGAVGYAAARSDRDRPSDRPITGSAVARTYSNDYHYVSFPLYGPWGYYYPWYGSGFGWQLGFVGYDPWRYYGTGWGWGRYGMWYDPYGYYPYYDPYFYGGGGGGGGGGSSEPKERATTGDIRLKANVKEAKVYIDGALYGTVDEFDGLGGHLELDGGRHTLELRADGYANYIAEIMVEPGKTLTHRASLKKSK
jgi:PEGA domain-containing protein